MHIFAILAFVVAPTVSHASQVPAKGSAEQRAIYERSQAEQRRFEGSLFVKAGFQPIADVADQKREIKRALFHDPYMILPVPGVEIERHANGSITLTVIDRTGKAVPAKLAKSAWVRLNSLQGTLLLPKPYVPWDVPVGKPSLPRSTCHGWIVRFEAVAKQGIESGGWTQCGGEQPERALATEFPRLAVSTRPDCSWDEADPFWAFQKCFGPHPQR